MSSHIMFTSCFQLHLNSDSNTILVYTATFWNILHNDKNHVILINYMYTNGIHMDLATWSHNNTNFLKKIQTSVDAPLQYKIQPLSQQPITSGKCFFRVLGHLQTPASNGVYWSKLPPNTLSQEIGWWVTRPTDNHGQFTPCLPSQKVGQYQQRLIICQILT